MRPPPRITSSRHPLVQTCKRLAAHRHPDPDGRILLDGPRLIEAALDAGAPLEVALFAPQAALSATHRVVARLRDAGVPVYQATERAVQAASQVTTSQGLVAIGRAPRPRPEFDLVREPDLVLLVADRVQDPGNVGTMVRTAVAAGATAFATTEGTADPFAPKALRATMGAAFALPMVQIGRARLQEFLHAARPAIYIADPRAGHLYTDVPWRPPLVIVVGNEAAGPHPSWSSMGELVRIPLYGPVESLNVAVAAGLLLYEVARRLRGRR
ncbi:MAG: RNA methyltransferase [Armatimonadota bacterium]|nr:RNA methyltransferase [Armatimonadota bacterium]MDR7532920.1 RNA methyltransferase [Armatimonadota bacterium]MDR7536127.1 RNA methyltransferase [Armatimonadota bacterium]